MSVFCDRRFIQRPNTADANLPEGTLSAAEICSDDVAPGRAARGSCPCSVQLHFRRELIAWCPAGSRPQTCSMSTAVTIAVVITCVIITALVHYYLIIYILT